MTTPTLHTYAFSVSVRAGDGLPSSRVLLVIRNDPIILVYCALSTLEYGRESPAITASPVPMRPKGGKCLYVAVSISIESVVWAQKYPY